MTNKRSDTSTRDRLLNAACELFVLQGFAGTSVDAICEKAGVTKGGFFHYFASKEACALDALDHFYEQRDVSLTGFLDARGSTGRQRVIDHIEFLSTPASMRYRGCLIGMLALETGRTNAVIRKKCNDLFERWTKRLADEVQTAGLVPGPLADPSLAIGVLAMFEGALVLARSRADPKIAADALGFLVNSLGTQPNS